MKQTDHTSHTYTNISNGWIRFLRKKVWVDRWHHITNLPMYPPWGPSPFLSSITRWGWLLTTLPSSFPFHVPSSSLNEADLNIKHLVQYCCAMSELTATENFQLCCIHTCHGVPFLLKNISANFHALPACQLDNTY